MPAAPYRTMEEAVAGLLPGDIVLFRNEKSYLFRKVRELTNSHWNHAGLVFDVVRLGTKTDTLVIEAGPHGIEVHRLRRYLDQPERYEVGLKRMPLLTPEYRGRFMGFFLDVLDTPYDFTRLFGYLFRRVVTASFGVKAHDFIANRLMNVDNFVCSSFIQRAYYLAVPPNQRDKTLFRDDQENLNFVYRMEYITPADIAKSKNTEWLYNPHD